ncbi:protein TonB-like [Macrobrachium nipponense]|uniref:protein TonB-like n=1 Tax=Macrobrachium nipponense TaxID=159736 RepID=UPI0030C7BAF0
MSILVKVVGIMVLISYAECRQKNLRASPRTELTIPDANPVSQFYIQVLMATSIYVGMVFMARELTFGFLEGLAPISFPPNTFEGVLHRPIAPPPPAFPPPPPPALPPPPPPVLPPAPKPSAYPPPPVVEPYTKPPAKPTDSYLPPKPPAEPYTSPPSKKPSTSSPTKYTSASPPAKDSSTKPSGNFDPYSKPDLQGYHYIGPFRYRTLESNDSFISRVLKSIDPMESAFAWLKVDERVCKERAVCELQKATSTLPLVNTVLGYIRPSIPGLSDYKKAQDAGAALEDCALLFSECPYSLLY